MDIRGLIDLTGAALATLGASIALAGALETHRRAPARALARLGIDQRAFARIRR